MPATTAPRAIRCSWRSRGQCASLIFHASLLRICCRRFVRTRPSLAYETFEDLVGYCHFSANPVGHLVLYLCGYRDAERQALSDCTCTALQLANFWQDVSVDYSKGRIYLPLEDLRRFQVSEEDIAAARNTPAFREMMRFEVERAHDWFREGWPLAAQVDRELAVDLRVVQPGWAGNPESDRTAGLCRAGTAPGNF